MVAPAAAAAAGWTIEEIAAGVGIAGTVGGGVGQAAASGGSGYNFSGPGGNVHYPKELGPARFLGAEQQMGGTFIRFHAAGYIWDNECTVRFHGLFSSTEDPVVGYTDNEALRGVPANRFIEVGFEKGGEELSHGLLNVGLSTYEAGVGGSPDQPAIIIHVGGHFDPVGSGDAEFSFNSYIDTFGRVWLGEVFTSTGGLQIYQNGNEISVYLDQ